MNPAVRCYLLLLALVLCGCSPIQPKRTFVPCKDPQCKQCLGTGKVRCRECEGRGSVECRRCGRVVCFA